MSNQILEELLRQLLSEVNQIKAILKNYEPHAATEPVKNRPRMSTESAAIAALHLVGPNKQKIANEIGCTRQQLYNLPIFLQAFEIAADRLKGGKRRRGQVSNGNLEAWESED